MSEKQRRISNLILNCFPGNYFLDSSVILRTVYPKGDEWRPIGEGEINDPRRLERRIWTAVRNATNAHADPMPYPDGARITFVEYSTAQVEVGYPTFICPDRTCERVYTLEEISRSNFRCSLHPNLPLAQMAHLFVHLPCGRVVLVLQERCFNMINGARCNDPLRLHIEYQRVDSSYWWCARCKNIPGMAVSAVQRNGDWQPGWKRDFRKVCTNCARLPSSDNGVDESSNVDPEDDVVRESRVMKVAQARSVYQPQRMDIVDLGTANDETALEEWFGSAIDTNSVRNQIPAQLRAMFDSDPKFRQQIISQYMPRSTEQSVLPAVTPEVREELRDYAGARAAVLNSPSLQTSQSLSVENRFGVKVSLLDNLGIIQATYGYLIGSADAAQAKLEVFGMGADRYGVLTQRFATEGLLIELTPSRVDLWLRGRGFTIPNGNQEQVLRRYLLTAPVSDPVVSEITSLLHTLSHTLIRSSERYTGIGRDTMGELIWPRTLSACLYNQRGSELGMLATTFEGRLRVWFEGALYDARSCPFDPVCAEDPQVAACMGCLHLSRCFAPYWNRSLDRRLLVTLIGNQQTGYWGDMTP